MGCLPVRPAPLWPRGLSRSDRYSEIGFTQNYLFSSAFTDLASWSTAAVDPTHSRCSGDAANKFRNAGTFDALHGGRSLADIR